MEKKMDKYKPMLIDANEIVTTMVMDEKTKTGTLVKMPISDALDKWTAEGCPKPIEAEQIKLGKWLDREPAPWGQVYETCSVCLERQTLDEGLDHFCPLCGAKMNSYKRKMDGRE